MQTRFTLGPEVVDDPYHLPVIRSQLTRNLGVVFPDLRDEIVSSFEDIIPSQKLGM
jgi:hypothetical protein